MSSDAYQWGLCFAGVHTVWLWIYLTTFSCTIRIFESIQHMVLFFWLHVFSKRGEQWEQGQFSFLLKVTHAGPFSLPNGTQYVGVTERYSLYWWAIDEWIFLIGTYSDLFPDISAFIMLREEMSWLIIVIFSSCAKPTYLEALYRPSSIWCWRQAYCSWPCRSSLSRCPRSGPHLGPRWWGYLEELRQDTQTILCKH